MDVFDGFGRDFFPGFEPARPGFAPDPHKPGRALYGKHGPHMMKTDVKETQDGFELDVDLPGIRKEDIHLALQNDCLVISAEKSMEKKDEDRSGRMVRRERYTGSMQRSFYVGKLLTEEDVKASYENGVLHIRIPKKEAPKVPEKKTILIDG